MGAGNDIKTLHGGGAVLVPAPVKKEIPAERFAEPDEIAGVIAFLCSNAAAMITGHNLLVDGGYTSK